MIILKFKDKEIMEGDFPTTVFYDGKKTYHVQLSALQFSEIIREYLENLYPPNPVANDL